MSDRSLTEAQIEDVRKEFDYFDKDNNGQIDMQEFIELLTILSPKTKANRVKEGFDLIDDNHDGFIDFEEFLKWWQEGWWEY